MGITLPCQHCMWGEICILRFISTSWPSLQLFSGLQENLMIMVLLSARSYIGLCRIEKLLLLLVLVWHIINIVIILSSTIVWYFYLVWYCSQHLYGIGINIYMALVSAFIWYCYDHLYGIVISIDMVLLSTFIWYCHCYDIVISIYKVLLSAFIRYCYPYL